MAEFARKSDVKLKKIMEVNYSVEDSDLSTLLEQLKSYARKRNSKPDDWSHNVQWLKKLRNKFLHFSAHYSGTGMEPRFVEGERKRLVYEG